MASSLLVLALGWCVCVHRATAESDGQTSQCSTSGSDGHCQLFSLPHTVISMQEKLSRLENRLQATDRELQELHSLIAGRPQVAFSVALRDSGSGNIGPFSTAVPLQYKKVFSNTGSSYNPSTGIFTAVVKGMYFFRFSMFNNLVATPSSVVSLKKNGDILASVWDTSGTDANDMGSNAVVVPLEVGDSVYVELHANRLVYDDGMTYNTFTGFLLFPM